MQLEKAGILVNSWIKPIQFLGKKSVEFHFRLTERPLSPSVYSVARLPLFSSGSLPASRLSLSGQTPSLFLSRSRVGWRWLWKVRSRVSTSAWLLSSPPTPRAVDRPWEFGYPGPYEYVDSRPSECHLCLGTRLKISALSLQSLLRPSFSGGFKSCT